MRIRVREGDRERAFDFEGDAVVAGRSPDCDIRLADVRAGRRHLRISRVEGGLRVEDLGSRNGTFLNGRPVRSAAFGPGDRIEVGDACIYLADERAATEGVAGPVILVETGAEVGRRYPLEPGRAVTLGRHPDSDLVLHDPRASAQHMVIEQEEGAWIVVDLGSTNGTRVNGKQVRRHPLVDGDRIHVEGIHLRYLAGGPADRASRRAPAVRPTTPPPAASVPAPAPPEGDDGALDGEGQAVAVDAARVEGRQGVPPLSVAIAVVVVGLIGYFAIQFLLGLSGREPEDSPPAGNLFVDWSFETGEARLAAFAEGATTRVDPAVAAGGRHALRVDPVAGAVLARVLFDPKPVAPEQGYTLRAAVRTEPRAGAGVFLWWGVAGEDRPVAITWGAPSTGGTGGFVSVRAGGLPPPGSSEVRAGLYTMGSGGGWFDRVELLEREDPDPEGPSLFRGPWTVRADSRGILRVDLGGRLLLGWTDFVLAAPADEGRAGCLRQAFARGEEITADGEAGRLAVRARILDPFDGRWVGYREEVELTGSGVTVRFEGESGTGVRAVLVGTSRTLPDPIRVASGREAPGAPEAGRPVSLVVWGRGAGQGAVTLLRPATLTVEDVGGERRLVLDYPPGEAVGWTLTSGNPAEREALARAFAEAAALEARGDRGGAIGIYRRVEREFAHIAATRDRAREAAEALEREAAAGLDRARRLASDLAITRRTEVAEALHREAEALIQAYAGTEAAEEAARLARDVPPVAPDVAGRVDRAGCERLLAEAGAHYTAGRIYTAEVFYREVVAASAGAAELEDLREDAGRHLEMIAQDRAGGGR